MSEDKNVISDEAAEAAAMAIFQNQTGMDWESRSDVLKAKFRSDARAALEAAAPHIAAEAWDEGTNAPRDYNGWAVQSNPYRSQA